LVEGIERASISFQKKIDWEIISATLFASEEKQRGGSYGVADGTYVGVFL